MGKQWKLSDFIFGGSKITTDGDCSNDIKRHLLLARKVMTNLDSILKSRHYFANKGPSSQGYGFSSGHVWMLRVGLWRKLSAEELMLLNSGVGEDSWESHGLQGCQSSQSKRKKSWIFIGRTDAEAEVPMIWPPNGKSWLIGKDPKARKD